MKKIILILFVFLSALGVNAQNCTTAAFTQMSDACQNLDIKFQSYTGCSAIGVIHLWEFGDGNTSSLANPTHTYSNPGNYTVHHQVQVNGQTHDSYSQVSMYCAADCVSAAFTPSYDACQNLTASFTSQDPCNAPGVIHHWDFGDGNTSFLPNPSHTYAMKGVYTVHHQVIANGLTHDSYLEISMYCEDDCITAAFSYSYDACEDLTIDFMSQEECTASGVIHHWDFGDGNTSFLPNPSHTYTMKGIYTIHHQVIANGLTHDSYIEISMYCEDDCITAAFSYSYDACEDLTVDFMSQEECSASGVIHSWDFGDGGTSFFPNPSHTYANPGVYTIHHQVIANGLTHDNYIEISMYCEDDCITAAFSYSYDACEDLTVDFKSQEECTASGVIHSWDFGDGGTSFFPNPSHTYANPGVYTIHHQVIANGLTHDNYIEISMYCEDDCITAAFSYSYDACEDLTVDFMSQEECTASGVIHSWDFGDGGTSFFPNPSHTYANPGVYTIHHQVIANGLTHDNYIEISMYCEDDCITAAFSHSFDACESLEVEFRSQDECTASGVIHSWDFGDGGTSFFPNPSHTYANPGTYTVHHQVTANGLTHDNFVVITLSYDDCNDCCAEPELVTISPTSCTSVEVCVPGVDECATRLFVRFRPVGTNSFTNKFGDPSCMKITGLQEGVTYEFLVFVRFSGCGWVFPTSSHFYTMKDDCDEGDEGDGGDGHGGDPRLAAPVPTTVQAYPNPFTDIVNISFFGESIDTYEFSVIDSQGRVMKTVKGDSVKGVNEIELSGLDALSPGIYFYRLQYGNHQTTGKLVKQ